MAADYLLSRKVIEMCSEKGVRGVERVDLINSNLEIYGKLFRDCLAFDLGLVCRNSVTKLFFHFWTLNEHKI